MELYRFLTWDSVLHPIIYEICDHFFPLTSTLSSKTMSSLSSHSDLLPQEFRIKTHTKILFLQLFRLLFQSWIEIIVPSFPYLFGISEGAIVSQLRQGSCHLSPIMILLMWADKMKLINCCWLVVVGLVSFPWLNYSISF